jgi:uncharacterized membrane protein YhaH (DUF805 family)
MVNYFWLFLLTGIIFVIFAMLKQVKNMNNMMTGQSSKNFFSSFIPVLIFGFIGGLDLLIGIILLVLYCVK